MTATLVAVPVPRFARLKWLARFALGLAVLVVLLWRTGVAVLFTRLQSVSPLLLLGSVVVYLAGQFISAYKWHLLLKVRGASPGLAGCCRLYLVGMFWNLWMPTNIGGDAVRAVRAAPQAGGKTAAASSIIVERFTGFLALLVWAIMGLLCDVDGSSAPPAAALRIVLATAALFALLFGIIVLTHRAGHHSQGKLQRKIAGVAAALVAYLDSAHRATLGYAMLLSLVFQASQIGLNIVLARSLGLAVPAIVFWWLVPVLALASLVPVGIGGLGVREAAAVTLLHGAGISTVNTTTTIVLWSLLWQVTVWLSSAPGVWWAFRGEGTQSTATPSSQATDPGL